jgi:hypothetical protein
MANGLTPQPDNLARRPPAHAALCAMRPQAEAEDRRSPSIRPLERTEVDMQRCRWIGRLDAAWDAAGDGLTKE